MKTEASARLKAVTAGPVEGVGQMIGRFYKVIDIMENNGNHLYPMVASVRDVDEAKTKALADHLRRSGWKLTFGQVKSVHGGGYLTYLNASDGDASISVDPITDLVCFSE